MLSWTGWLTRRQITLKGGTYRLYILHGAGKVRREKTGFLTSMLYANMFCSL